MRREERPEQGEEEPDNREGKEEREEHLPNHRPAPVQVKDILRSERRIRQERKTFRERCKRVFVGFFRANGFGIEEQDCDPEEDRERENGDEEIFPRECSVKQEGWEEEHRVHAGPGCKSCCERDKSCEGEQEHEARPGVDCREEKYPAEPEEEREREGEK